MSAFAARQHDAQQAGAPVRDRARAAQRQRTAGCVSNQVFGAAVTQSLPSLIPIAAPWDRAEREADSVAASVSPVGTTLQRSCECGGTCDDCRARMMRKGEGAAAAAGPSTAPLSVHSVLQSPGLPMDRGVAAELGARFSGVFGARGVDFGGVRIHTDAAAASSARDVHAAAYTVGHHVVFAEGRYQPHSEEGRALLAHELAHVVQQSLGNRAMGRLLRTWDAPKAKDCTDVAGKKLDKVVVQQEVPQTVTLHWSDGTQETGSTSTGKGHCCTESPEQVACSEAGSRQNGSNCTPITTGKGYTITDRYLDFNGYAFWNMFVPSRGIGLHTYYKDGVTGHALSHGCVRLNEVTARHIFCGARQYKTHVEVKGFARPHCADPEVQKAWQESFSYAGTALDGEPDPAVRRGVREERETLRKLFDVDDKELDTLIQKFAKNPAALTPQIPRCTAAAEPDELVKSAKEFASLLKRFTAALRRLRSLSAAEASMKKFGQELWSLGTAAYQRTAGPVEDDRVLFWTRQLLLYRLQNWKASFALSKADRDKLAAALEQSSRGMDSAVFAGTAAKKVLVSGFDPFGLRDDVRANNPAGAAALLLDGRTLTSGAVTAEVQSVIFPVRFTDFNAGIVESFFRPYLKGPNRVDMIMTISQGRAAFEVEQFAGKRRSTGISDDWGVSGGGTRNAPAVPPGVAAASPEFLPTALPAKQMRASLGRKKPLQDETEVVEIPKGGTKPARRATGGPTAGSTAVAGSGGGFLSNEIMYRTLLLRTDENSTVPVGHLHVPIPTAALDAPAIARRVQKLIEDTLAHI